VSWDYWKGKDESLVRRVCYKLRSRRNGTYLVERKKMSPTMRSQEILRRLAIIDEGFIAGQAELGLDPAAISALDPRTVALLRLGAAVAIGSPAVLLEWSTTRALAAGASDEEIVEMLLAIAPVAGLSRVVSAVHDVADALEYDIDAALLESDHPPMVSSTDHMPHATAGHIPHAT